ncbi:nucleotidyltransferase [Mycolicibacterium austroafricanum]|uniref:nucleotidyltransferase n=1 Tax=Mycolicibacterium austroafricanum TaxID=39687 RepID=UPI0005623AA7|nr:nucleotidyltransferase [Mycolicibacterium austroafricanum]QZY47022.1 nucleotidyltransferase [Mycolicibacterium austroafricanum]
MSVNDAFRTFQDVVNADIAVVREARGRRDLFRDAFKPLTDVDEIIPSGSLARGTQKDPIRDVDVIIVFAGGEHPDWGEQGASAKDALDYTREQVHDLLGATDGTHAQEVRLARWRNHAVKCFLDDPNDPDAFTVDAMPALRRDGKLLIPQAASEEWINANPEYLIAEVAAKHAAWNKFAGSVRMLKWWAAEQNIKIKSLVMEVLALQFLPITSSQPSAITQFFVSAAYHIEGGGEVVDPAGLCGPVQSDLDFDQFADCLSNARDSAAKASQAQVNNDTNFAIYHWGTVFGDEFPRPATTPISVVAPPPRPVKDTPQG